MLKRNKFTKESHFTLKSIVDAEACFVKENTQETLQTVANVLDFIQCCVDDNTLTIGLDRNQSQGFCHVLLASRSALAFEQGRIEKDQVSTQKLKNVKSDIQ